MLQEVENPLELFKGFNMLYYYLLVYINKSYHARNYNVCEKHLLRRDAFIVYSGTHKA